MGAGQIGGIATVLNMDFNNAAGFLGADADNTEAQYLVYFLSHALMFCVGSMLEPHVVLTPASCVFGEQHKFEVYGGSHLFVQYAGVPRVVHHLCIHKGYNHTGRWGSCTPDNLALLLLSQPFSFHKREAGTDFILNRVRYGSTPPDIANQYSDTSCSFYGWGSRRNGYLVPLLIRLKRVDVTLLHPDKCADMWDNDGKYLCMRQPACRSGKYGALCPDDMGALLVCSGYARGMMISRLVDRPCGVGFVDLTHYAKFLTCGVDDSRDVINHDDFMTFEYTKSKVESTIELVTPPVFETEAETTTKPVTTTPTKPGTVDEDGDDDGGDDGDDDDGDDDDDDIDLDEKLSQEAKESSKTTKRRRNRHPNDNLRYRGYG